MRRLQYPAAVLVACLWTLSFCNGIIRGNWQPWDVMTPVVLLVAGAIVTAKNGTP